MLDRRSPRRLRYLVRNSRRLPRAAIRSATIGRLLSDGLLFCPRARGCDFHTLGDTHSRTSRPLLTVDLIVNESGGSWGGNRWGTRPLPVAFRLQTGRRVIQYLRLSTWHGGPRPPLRRVDTFLQSLPMPLPRPDAMFAFRVVHEHHTSLVDMHCLTKPRIHREPIFSSIRASNGA